MLDGIFSFVYEIIVYCVYPLFFLLPIRQRKEFSIVSCLHMRNRRSIYGINLLAPECYVRGRAGRPARPRTQHDCHHDTKVKPEAATAVIELLIMGGKTPETR